jgi:hypothetical protein
MWRSVSTRVPTKARYRSALSLLCLPVDQRLLSETVVVWKGRSSYPRWGELSNAKLRRTEKG